jgi:membrane protein
MRAAASKPSPRILASEALGSKCSVVCPYNGVWSPLNRPGILHNSMGEFFSGLKSALGRRMLWEVVLGVRRNDLLGLAGQLAYFFLLFFFPFLIFLVSLTGLVIGNPEAGLKSLFEALAGLVPANARALVVDYVDSTLRSASTGALVLGIVDALWLGQAAAISITKAANRSYRLEESRPFWRLRGACLIITLGFSLLIAVLTVAVFNVGSRVSAAAGLPEGVASLGKLSSWAMVFVAVTLSLDLLYYLAPDAKLPFKWITPGGFIATVLLFASDGALSYYVANLGNHGQIYGQLGTVIVFMLWLYVTGLMVLLGLEINAVLARVAEEKKGIELVQAERSADE